MDYKELINSNPVVVVEFYASWCPHCQRMMPVVDQIKQLLGDKATVHQFDIDENQSLADRSEERRVVQEGGGRGGAGE